MSLASSCSRRRSGLLASAVIQARDFTSRSSSSSTPPEVAVALESGVRRRCHLQDLSAILVEVGEVALAEQVLARLSQSSVSRPSLSMKPHFSKSMTKSTNRSARCAHATFLRRACAPAKIAVERHHANVVVFFVLDGHQSSALRDASAAQGLLEIQQLLWPVPDARSIKFAELLGVDPQERLGQRRGRTACRSSGGFQSAPLPAATPCGTCGWRSSRRSSRPGR